MRNVAMIVAMNPDRVIGKDNTIPWYYPEDLKFFKKLTTGNTVIMGRKTYESIGEPLPNRRNIVVSSTMEPVDEVEVYSTVFGAIHKANPKRNPVFIIGGSAIYREGMNYVDTIYLTLIPDQVKGDNLAYFPEIDLNVFGFRWQTSLSENIAYQTWVRR